MGKLSVTLKNIAERQDLVMEERLKREWIKDGYEIPADINRRKRSPICSAGRISSIRLS